MPSWFFLTALFVFGLVFGSFANVVIWRLPRGESLSHPPSRCPVCDTPIEWRDNIPVLGWLLLRGKCRACGTPISPRYPIVELLSGALWLFAGLKFGQTWQTALAVTMFYILMVLAFIDWDTMRLPNPLVALLAAAGLLGALVSAFTAVELGPLVPPIPSLPLPPLSTALLGAVLGAAVSLGIALVYRALRNVEGFGAGDIKLLAAMGLYLGPYVLIAFFIGAVLGAGYGIFLGVRRGGGLHHRFPFGPFLAIAGILTALGGPAIWSGYLSLLG